MRKQSVPILVLALAVLLSLMFISSKTNLVARCQMLVNPEQATAGLMSPMHTVRMGEPARGFTAGSGISISFSQPSYAWTTTAQTVTAQVIVAGAAEPETNGDVTVSGPGTIAPAAFTLPNGGAKTLQVTLPVDPGAYTYTATISRHVNDDPHRHEDISASVTVYVVKVESLIPDAGTAFDDGDNDLDTQAYIVPMAASGVITVTATPNASVPEELLPSDWSLTGGTPVGGGQLQQTVPLTTPAQATLMCRCGDSMKTVNIYVVSADLQCGSLAEASEETPGAFLGVNDNDNNANGVADLNEQPDANGITTVTNEADLVPVALVLPSHPTAGAVTLSGTGPIRLWTKPTKGTEISLQASWTFTDTDPDPVPPTVYAEGTAASTTMRDASLTLTYTLGNVSVTDSVNLTVVKTVIGGAGSEGLLTIVNRDDDNGNDIPDLNDTGTVANEDDLVPITLSLYPTNLDAGTLTLTLPDNLAAWTGTKGAASPLQWTIPVNGIAFVPITVYLEGTAASRAVQDGTLTLAYAQSGKTVHAHSVKSTVADLTIALNTSTILTNTDDDDTDSAADLGQVGPVTSENDLKQMRIAVSPAGLTGTLTASARTILFSEPDEYGQRTITGYDAPRLNFYMDAAKGLAPPTGTSWPLSPSTPAPEALWLEGASVSDITGDQEITVQLTTGGHTLTATTTATVNAHPGTSEVTFKLYGEDPIGQDADALNSEISGDVGGKVYVVMEVKLGPGEKLASSSAVVRINDTWSGYEADKSRAWVDIPVDFTSTDWSEMVNDGGDLTWSQLAPASTDNANGAMYRTFYLCIKTWDTPAEPYTEYYQQATESWIHFEDPTVGHNGEHTITIVAVDDDEEKTGLDFQHYDAHGQPPGWQAATEVGADVRTATVANLVVTSLEPGNGTIDYIKYDPDPDGKYHRPTMKVTFKDTNPSGQNHTYVCYWMLLATASPKPREHLDMNDVYSRADAVINTPSTPTTVHFTWQGHVGEIDATNPPPDVEYDVAEWGTYTYDVDVIEYDANDEMVDWHSYKWPSCLGIGEHKVFARDNEDISGSTLNYRYVLQDIANDDITGYYPNAMDPSELQVLTIDSNLNEVSTNDLEEYIDGQLRGGVAISSTELSSYFDNWRTVYIGQDNCWRADRRDHISSRMLAVNAVVSPSLVLDVFPNDEVAIGTPLSISVIKTKANEAGDLLPVAGAKIRFLVWWEKSRWAYFGMGTTGADGIIATNYVAYAPVDTYPHVKEVNKFMAIEVNDGDYFLPKDPANNALSKSNIREINICD